MSLFDRRPVLLVPFAVAACGFTPVYAPGGTGSQLQGQVAIQDPFDRESFVLFRELEARLGRGIGTYGLAFDMRIDSESLGVTQTGEFTRFNLIGTVDYTLFDIATEEVIFADQTTHFTGYSATGDTVETLAAERDARERLAIVLADQIVTELYAQVTLPPQ